MDVDQQFEQEWISIPAATADPEKISAYFDCSICLDFARDPVVTLCGHLYCWPCIYKWLLFQSSSLSPEECTQCPVCKAGISNTSLVPLYGHGRTLSEAHPDGKATSPGSVIPPRPTAFARQSETTSPSYDQRLPYHHSYENVQNFHYEEYSSPTFSNFGSTTAAAVSHPVIRMFGELVYARVFGNSENLFAYPNSYYLVGRSNRRIRRMELQAHQSLSRVSFFLFCCLLLCLLLF